MGRFKSTQTVEERFFAKVHFEPTSGCWLWEGYASSQGYGTFWFNGMTYWAHRASLIIHGRDIPDGMATDHLCRNPACVNPDHLEVVTVRENTRRGTGPSGINAKKQVCCAGHPFDEGNTYILKDGNRVCRRCQRENRRKRYHSSHEARDKILGHTRKSREKARAAVVSATNILGEKADHAD